MNLENRLRANIRLLEGQRRTLDFINTDSSPIDTTIADPVDWIKQARRIENEPFSFGEMQYLEGIQRDTSHVINIVKPRQMGVTELILNWLLFNLIKNPGTVGVYVTDRYEHGKIFSNKRLSEAIAQSRYLSTRVPKNRGNLKWQPFNNGSNLYILSAWGNFEEARSISADFAAVDEMQSVNVSSLSVLTESMSRSKFRKIIKVGTGSDEGDPWWDEGTEVHSTHGILM
jgi:phage terminase large subunit GpA-like protein